MNSSDSDVQARPDKDIEESENRTVKCQDNESISSGTEDINPLKTLTNTGSFCKPFDSDNTKIKCDEKIISCKNNTSVLSQEITRKELGINEFCGGGSHGDIIHKQVFTRDHWPVLLVSKDKHGQKKKPYRKKDPIAIERSNLVNVTKLVVKELIESSLKYGRMLDSDHVSLNHFFILLEHVMRHGLMPKKGLLGPKKELWNLLETVEKYMPEASDITSSVRELPTVKTHLGRARAWLRLALMQKRLADYFRFLTDKKEEILILYMYITIIHGVISFSNIMSQMEDIQHLQKKKNLSLEEVLKLFFASSSEEESLSEFEEETTTNKDGEEHFSLHQLPKWPRKAWPVVQNGNGKFSKMSSPDCWGTSSEESLFPVKQQGVIDFSLYLRENSHTEPLPEGANSASMTAVLDQKNYIEELNRHLNATVSNLQQKVEQLQTANTLMKEDLAIAKNQVLMLDEENSRLQCARREHFTEHNKKIVETQEDLILERETYHNNQAGLENLCSELKKKLQEESSLKQDIEQDLQTQIALKTEAEMALKLLEKGVHEKQDTIISLRRQIEDIKIINLQMYNKLQECENLVKEKTDQVSQLQKKVSEMTFSLQQLEAKANRAEQDHVLSEEARRKLGQQLAEKDQKRSILESDLKIEREWRASLQASVAELQEQLTTLQNDLDTCQQKSSEYEKLEKDFHCLRNTCQEYETALEEMGVQLSDSKLQLEDLKESHYTLKEAVWTSDKEATTCRQCSKPFSVARRKHHCRSCGDIFCRNCSDNTMPLPSSSKPVRVCDGCHTLLLQRYSAT
ncbi:RUN and FYVE domain-containing protein 2-like [Limulus polyphemus]|uniref:RUN and FYVE domain-containing protein 2-like n=1 Tax=Limulus polyphemus TaxID=6850 RepID=A0ABM1SL91_LIMPO|nr:RUN and FYVE domain-containing protein 2-like [Limulus polyphemus]